MRIGRRRAEQEEQWPEDAWDQEPQAQSEDVADTGEEETGWNARATSLSGMTRLARFGAWALVGGGPLVAVMALLSSSSPTPEAPRAVAPAQQASGTGPAGFATLFVDAYLQAGQGTESTLSPFYAGSLTMTNPPGARNASQLVTIASREIQAGYWSITVAANVDEKNSQGSYTDLGLQYFQVPVQAVGPASAGGTSGGAVGYTATALPAQVAAPAGLTPSSLEYTDQRGVDPNDPATQTASGLLSSYLAGQGALNRYLAPGLNLQPVSPAPYTSVTVTNVVDDAANPTAEQVPAAGTTRHLLVTVNATDASGATYPLTYALQMTVVSGLWSVSALDAAPALQYGSAPALVTPSPDASDSSSSGSTGAPAPVPSPSAS